MQSRRLRAGLLKNTNKGFVALMLGVCFCGPLVDYIMLTDEARWLQCQENRRDKSRNTSAGSWSNGVPAFPVLCMFTNRAKLTLLRT